MRIAFLLAGAGLAALLSGQARATGIDCATAEGLYGKAICADPSLHQLDQDLAVAYAKLATGASAGGQALIQRDEHDRRAYIEELCAPNDKACLAAAYRQAGSSLARFAAQPTGAVLLPIEQFTLRPDKTSVLIASPRIDSPAETWARGFETAAREVADGLQADDPETDTVIDYRPTSLAPDLAAVAFSVWTFPRGAAHGLGHQVAFTYLPTQRRGMRATDLFQSGTTWSGFLAEQALAGLEDQAKAGGWDLMVSGPGELEKAIADPANWLIRPDGLGLYFAPETVGPYVAGEREVLVPWADLRPYLSATTAFKLP
ncbi:MAG: hypothetical protein JWO51_3453 [Rhodospirillales bacterium]|nr:hypothetical protein [Rhodospirillales bacterium]